VLRKKKGESYDLGATDVMSRPIPLFYMQYSVLGRWRINETSLYFSLYLFDFSLYFSDN
jgi:hypothetical protein